MTNKIRNVKAGDRVNIRGREYDVLSVTMGTLNADGVKTPLTNLTALNADGNKVVFDLDEAIRVKGVII